MGEKRRPASISSVLQGMFDQHPMEKRLREGRIWLVWDEAVGEKIAAKAHPAKFHDGLLTVNVSSAPWLQQLTFLKSDIKNKINTLLGEELVVDIFLKSGRMPKREVPSPPPQVSLQPASAEELAKIAEQTAEIADEELRIIFQDLILKNMNRKR